MNAFRRPPDIPKLVQQKDTSSLIKLLRHRNFDIQWQAAEALARIGKEAIPELLRALKTPYIDIRLGAIEALGDIGHPDAVNDLIHVIRADPNSEIRWAGALMLGQIGDSRAIEPLTQLLKEPDKYVRFGAALALEKLKWSPLNNIEKAYYYVAKQEWNSLPHLGDTAIEPLIHMLKISDTRVRERIIDIIGQIGSQKAKNACNIALKDTNSNVRWKAMIAFPKCGLPIMHLVRGLSRRPRTDTNPLVAAFLNFLFLGMGYNYLGKWWGFLLFQINLTLIVIVSLLMGPLIPYIGSYVVSSVFSIHAWYMAKNLPEL